MSQDSFDTMTNQNVALASVQESGSQTKQDYINQTNTIKAEHPLPAEP